MINIFDQCVLGQGVHYIGVVVTDKWGAEYKFTPSQSKREVIVDPPPPMAAGDGGGAKDKLEAAKASGDKSALLMFLQAQSNMLSQASSSGGGGSSSAGNSGSNAGSIAGGPSEGNGLESGNDGGIGEEITDSEGDSNSGSETSSSEEKSKNTEKNKEDAAKKAAEAQEAKAEEAAAAQGDMKVDQITAVLETGGGKVTNIAGAEIMSKTIESIVGKPAQEGEKTALGQEILKKTTAILEDLVGSMTDLNDIADPEQLKPSVTSVTTTIGTLLDALFDMSNNPDDEEEEVATKNEDIPIDEGNGAER